MAGFEVPDRTLFMTRLSCAEALPMNVTDDRAKSIFLNAAGIVAVEERRAFIECQCAGNEILRGEVEELLLHQQSLGSSRIAGG